MGVTPSILLPSPAPLPYVSGVWLYNNVVLSRVTPSEKGSAPPLGVKFIVRVWNREIYDTVSSTAAL
jgi:hypothetical protein